MKKAFPAQSLELALSAPHVMFQRLLQLSSAGFLPSASHYQEINLMWAEKLVGFSESLLAVNHETARLQQQILVSTAGYWMVPWLLPQAMLNSSVAHIPGASEKILSRAMAPIHGKVVANARRLSQK